MGTPARTCASGRHVTYTDFVRLHMKRLLTFVALFLVVGLSSCQCSDKPDIGPVEGDDEQSALVVSGNDFVA